MIRLHKKKHDGTDMSFSEEWALRRKQLLIFQYRIFYKFMAVMVAFYAYFEWEIVSTEHHGADFTTLVHQFIPRFIGISALVIGFFFMLRFAMPKPGEKPKPVSRGILADLAIRALTDLFDKITRDEPPQGSPDLPDAKSKKRSSKDSGVDKEDKEAATRSPN